MQNVFRNIFSGILALVVLFFSLQSLSLSNDTDKKIDLPKVVQTPLDAIVKEMPVEINNIPFRDNKELYQNDDPGSVVFIYITVRKGNKSENTDSTWQEINNSSKWFYTDNKVVQVGQAEAIVKFGDENGPVPGEVGYGEVVPNATIQIRGASTSLEPQKSYKIELNQGAGKWRGQSTIALNKHIFDPSRLRNKLNFDLMKQIPGMVSLRTQFVHLYVKDETSESKDTVFVDYGLFTQVELPNKAFLKAHLLDSNGQLYKTTFFEFGRYPDQIRLVDDPLFDENTFSSIMEIKGNRDNSKLIKMLDDLNNYDIPIETTFEKYFDAENYFTWMAYNILVGNVDTSSQNFYLYSPQNSDKFYFIPWDYDDSFFRQDREACCGYFPYYSYEYGIANYWGTTLAERVLKTVVYRNMLDTKVLELKDFLSPERINGLLNSYMGVIEKYAFVMPDVQYFPTTKEGMRHDIELMPSEININYNLYLESLETSLPFFLGTPSIVDGSLSFNWDPSYDLNDQGINYHFILAKDVLLQEIIYDQELPNNLSLQTTIPEPGEYFWTVTATNSSGNIQLPFNSLWDSNNTPHSGIKRFYISDDGQVLEK